MQIMFSFRSAVISVICLASLSATTPSQAMDQAAKDRFLNEAPAAWKAFRESARHVETSMIDTRVWGGKLKDRGNEELRFNVKFCGKTGLVVEDTIRGRRAGESLVACINSRYAFKLIREAGSKNWFILDVGTTEKSRQAARERLAWDADVLAEYPIWLHGISLPELTNLPGFTLDDVKFEESGCVVSFTFKPTEGMKPYLRKGTLILDPQHSWVVKKYNGTWEDEKGHGIESIEWEYVVDEKSKSIIPLRRTRKSKGITAGYELVWTVEYSSYKHREIPEQEFSLSAFVLPEIVRDARQVTLIVVENPVQKVGELGPNVDTAAHFILLNRSNQPIRILGAKDGCGINGCFNTRGLPATIDPHGKLAVDVGYRKGDTGPFSVTHTFFTDCPGQTELTVTIQGKIVKGEQQKENIGANSGK